MAATSFEKVMASLERETFDEGKMAVLVCGMDSDGFECEELLEFLKHFTWSKGRLEALTLFAQTKECTGTSSIINPEVGQALVAAMDDSDNETSAEQLLADAVPGKRAEFPSDDAISEMVTLQEAEALSSEAIEVLASEMQSTGGDDDEKISFVQRFLQDHPKQFTASQVATLLETLNYLQSRMDLAKMLRQRVVGMSCAGLLQLFESLSFSEGRLAFIEEMRFNLVDPQNKHVLIKPLDFSKDKTEAARLLSEICGRSPPNNPVFGRVEGDPVVFIIDKSGSMSRNFLLGGKSYSRDRFCFQEFEKVCKGLLPTSRFNVIKFSYSASLVFDDAVPASEENINYAIEAIATGRVNGSTNSLEALRLAYEMETSPQQIYFLSDGIPDQTTNEILEAIDGLDQDRRIPVNSIVFSLPGYDEGASNFMAQLANKTGGFFRAVASQTLAEA